MKGIFRGDGLPRQESLAVKGLRLRSKPSGEILMYEEEDTPPTLGAGLHNVNGRFMICYRLRSSFVVESTYSIAS